MSIQSEINKLRSNLANSYEAASLKGATLPSAQNFDNLASAISTISSGGDIDNINVYTSFLVEEVERELYYSSLTRAGLKIVDILGDNSTLTPLRSTWSYKPANLAEYYQEILTCDLLYAEQKLTEILGEINE